MDTVTVTVTAMVKTMKQRAKRAFSRADVRSKVTRGLSLAVVGAGLMWLVLAKTASNLYDAKRPEIAVLFDSGNHSAYSGLAVREFSSNGTDLNLGKSVELAERALLISPIDSNALAVLSLAAQTELGQDPEVGQALLEKAHAYAPRALLPQVLLIDHAAKAGDISRVLALYDLTLTTQPDSQELLLPRLFSTLSSPFMRSHLIARLEESPDWKKDFWLGLSDRRPIPPGALELYSEIKNKNSATVPGIADRFVRALISERRFDDAQKVALAASGDDSIVNSARRLNDFKKDRALSGFDWRYRSSGSHVAVPESTTLLLSARGQKSVLLADRLLHLEENVRFRVSGKLQGEVGAARITIQARCVGNRVPFLEVSRDVREGQAAVIDIPAFSVPASECEWQWLELHGNSADRRTADMIITELQLTNA